MSETATEPKDNQNLSSASVLADKRNALENARKEYFAVVELVQQRQKEVNEALELFGQCVIRKNDLVELRDNLNTRMREKRNQIREIELNLANVKEELVELEELAKDVRKDVPKAKGNLDKVYQEHESAKNRLSEAQDSLNLALLKVKDAEITFQAVGGVLPKGEIPTQGENKDKHRQNPWISGSFYVVAAAILMTVIAVISANVPWYALVIVLIGGLITIAIVGAFQLRHDEALSEENFITLMLESIKHLPLLRGAIRSEPKIDEAQTNESSGA